MLDKEIRKRKLVIGEVISDDNINKVLKDIKLDSLDELYLSIGSLRFTPSYIIDLIYEDKKDVMDIYLDRVQSNTYLGNRAVKGDIIVAGTDDILVTIAKCCKPIKGDKIVGYITKGEGITVHRADCPNIFGSERLIDVEWNMDSDATYLTDITVSVLNDKNRLLDIITKASQRDVFLEAVNTINEDTLTTYRLTIKTKSISDLNNFVDDIKALPFVREVTRKNN